MSTYKAKRPSDWITSERLTALIASGGIDEETRSAYCRAQGSILSNLQQWQHDFSQMRLGKGSKDSQAMQSLK